MNERQDMSADAADRAPDVPQTRLARPPLLVAATVVLFAEGAALVLATAWLVFELMTATPASMATALAFLVMCALAAFWVLATAVGVLRAQPWSRGSGITWQIIQAAIAVTAIEAASTRVAGILLLAAAIAGIALLLMPSVIRATAHRAVE